MPVVGGVLTALAKRASERVNLLLESRQRFSMIPPPGESSTTSAGNSVAKGRREIDF